MYHNVSVKIQKIKLNGLDEEEEDDDYLPTKNEENEF